MCVCVCVCVYVCVFGAGRGDRHADMGRLHRNANAHYKFASLPFAHVYFAI